MKDIFPERAAESLIWLATRQIELKLFSYLQRVSNETTFDDNDEQHAYILCLLATLLPISAISELDIKHFGLVSSRTDVSD
jgi:hypothetical protein